MSSCTYLYLSIHIQYWVNSRIAFVEAWALSYFILTSPDLFGFVCLFLARTLFCCIAGLIVRLLIFVLDLFSCCFLSCLWFLLFISLVNLFIRTPKCSFNPHYFGVYTIYKLALNRPHSYFFTYIHCMFDIDHYVIFCIIILVLFMSKTDYADVLLLLFYMYWTEIWINWIELNWILLSMKMSLDIC